MEYTSNLDRQRFGPIQWLLAKPEIALDAIAGIRHMLVRTLGRNEPKGIYEILSYDSTLEIQDPVGEVAIFRRQQRVRFLQSNVIAYQDHAWGDGALFAEYRCSPGVVVDRYREGDRWNILISLRETKSKGDIEDIHIERTVRNGFTHSEEWRQTEIWHPMRYLRLSIVFPADRQCRRAILQTRSKNKTEVLGNSNLHLLPDGRQMLAWEKKHPPVPEVYTIRWNW